MYTKFEVGASALAILDLLAFNNQKLGGHVTLATPLLENFQGVVSELSLGYACHI